MAGGRPSKWKDEYIDQAYKLCLLGATDADLAGFFGVDERTINRWKKEIEQFCQSLKKGKYIADAEITESLHKRAKGHITRIQKAFKVKHIKYDNGRRLSEDEEIVHDYDEIYTPPDTTAAIFWLKNRQPQHWRDKQEIEHSGDIGITIIDDIK